MPLLISKADEKKQTIVTINGQGVFFQELRLGDRPQSPRVRIAKLALVEEQDIIADYDVLNNYESLLVSRDTSIRTLAAAKSVLATLTDKKAIAAKDELIKKLEKEIPEIEEAIAIHPIRCLTSFNASTMQAIDKLLDKVRYRHQSIQLEDKSVKFTHYPSKAYFYQKQAEDLLLRHNENLEKRGIEVGFMDFDQALEIIKARFSKTPAVTKPKLSATTPVAEPNPVAEPKLSATTPVAEPNPVAEPTPVATKGRKSGKNASVQK